MPTAIALGNFDGVHKAHEALVRNMMDEAKRRNLRSIVYMFEPHPRLLLAPESAPKLLMTTKMKVRRLLEIGADAVHVEERGKDILSLSPAAFIEKVLVGELHAKFVTAGFNYRFGKNAEGDADALKALCAKNGIACRIMENMEIDGETVSSTRLRKLLVSGAVSAVNAMSFAPYTISGIVTEGKRLGRKIGFPTINIPLEKELLLPRKGVYVSLAKIGGKTYKSVTNIGENPTVEKAVCRAESHLLDFSEEAYGREAEISLLEFIRPEQRFADTEALCTQIRQDTDKTELYFERMDI